VLLSVATYLGSLVGVAAVAFVLVLVVAGPHAGSCPTTWKWSF